MSYLLDTCVISEFNKPSPYAPLIAWLNEQAEEDLFLSVVTIGEVFKGIAKLADDRPKKNILEEWVKNVLIPRFDRRLLEIDEEIMRVWGKIMGGAEKQGEKLPIMDALIAAVALTAKLTVVTRNDKDLKRCGAPTYNPWLI